ncbi:hypothetical protein BS17DRAFT_772921 [Gyrodon lividus]|nr:hypothetical protein BS17DRAFT_772921 [Gyrodon lividus]
MTIFSLKVVQGNRHLAAGQKSAFDGLLTDLMTFRQAIRPQAGASASKRRAGNHRAVKCAPLQRGSSALLVMPRSEPSNSLLPLTAHGTTSRTWSDYAQHVEGIAEDLLWSSFSCVNPRPRPEETNPTVHKQPERKRPRPAVNISQLAILPVRLDALLRDLRAFIDRISIFSIIFEELEREHDIFVIYLKDGQSVTHLGYRSEINRLRKHLPDICHALDAYSKGRLS